MNDLTQTEYLEETGLRAEARGCAGEHGRSHPQDVGPCEIVYTYTISHATEERRASSCHCFLFLSFEVKTKNFCFGQLEASFFLPSFFCLLLSLVFCAFGPLSLFCFDGSPCSVSLRPELC